MIERKGLCVAKVTAVMPVITAVSTMSLSHCVWLRKASTVSVPEGLARSSICRVHYKPSFPLSSSMLRCRPFSHVLNTCTQHSQLDTLCFHFFLYFLSDSTVWLDLQGVKGVKSLGGNNTAGQWVCGHSSPAFPASAVFMCHSHAGCLLAVCT